MEKLPIEIQTNVDGRPVRGRIESMTQRTIEVEILHPYDGVSQGRSIPAFAMPAAIASGHIYADDAGLSSEGRESAEGLLEALHRACVFFYKNRRELGEEFSLILKREESVAQIGNDIFHAARIKLRTRLKSGELTRPEFQKALAPLASKHKVFKTLRQRVEHRLEEVVLSKYGMLIPYGTLEQLIRKFLV